MYRQICCSAALLALFLATTPDAAAQLRAQPIVSGIPQLLGFVQDPADRSVQFLVRQTGTIHVLRNGAIAPVPFLDLSGDIKLGREGGLLGLVFAQDAATRRFWVNFTNREGHTVIARFQRSASDPYQADLSTRFDLLWPGGNRFIVQPTDNHNGGHLAFGSDGYLYIGMGDGGPDNDRFNNAQAPETLLGKMLRIDVNVPDDDPKGYRIPPDNPFLDGEPVRALGEIWAFGLRNPWKYSFDDPSRGGTGALIVADVGQNQREEINYEPRGAGGRNYGWRNREGSIQTPLIQHVPPAFTPLTDPIVDYDHSVGQSVTGGFVYRGAALGARYQGRYFVADYAQGRVWSLGLRVDPATGEARVTDATEHTAELSPVARTFISSFGTDADGELYLVQWSAPQGTGGIFKIAPATAGALGAPSDLQATIIAATVTLSWSAPAIGTHTHYVIDAGSVPGASNLAQLTVAGSQTSITVPDVPAGVYYVRVRSVNSAETSAASNEVVLAINSSGCTAPPAMPLAFSASVNGRVVTLSWVASPDTNAPSVFVLEAGSVAGANDLAVIEIDGTQRAFEVAAPPGQYFVRVRARNECGIGAATADALVTVP
jgi:glucose/arabinose dehydrogenase